MKERPILFSAPMVRALLAGTKTQTRRVVKTVAMLGGWETGHNARGEITSRWPLGRGLKPSPCPYGQPGDRLWVREAWRAPLAYELTPPRDIPAGTPIVYAADGAGSLPHFNAGKYRPPMFMPRWASRITLEVTGVRVERLQDISEADCIAEGTSQHPDGPWHAYRSLWTLINGPESWAANPWVWAISFKRI